MGRSRSGPLASLAVAAAIVALGACGSDDKAASTTTSAPSAAAAVTIPVAEPRLDANKFKEFIAQPGVVIVDVRTPAEFADGHIAGAINIDVENPNFVKEIDKLDRSTTYAVYCRSGNRSQTATKIMGVQGFRSTVDLGGGVQSWQVLGYPLEK